MTIRVDGRYKLGFVHIPKTSGTSIKTWIQEIATRRGDFKIKELPFHAPLPSLRVPSDYTTCSVIRNPWDRLVSIYEYDDYCRLNSPPEGGFPRLAGKPEEHMGFRDWIKYIDRYHWVYPQDKDYNVTKMWFTPTTPQTVWLPWDPHILIRYENLGQGYELLHEIMQCHDISIGHEYNTKHGPYQDYYDDASRKIVEHYFKLDIDRWNYKF